ncbi:MAG: hypothetical protein ACT4QF_22685 [Sporichthyaceae bacterium]
MKVDALPRGPLAAAAAGVLGTGGSLLGQEGLLLPVLAAQTLLAVGLFAVLHVPGARFNVPLIVLAALIGDVAMIVEGEDPTVAPLAGVLGPAVALAILAQLARYDATARVTASLTATLTALTCALLGATLLAARATAHGQTLTVVTILAASAATAVLTAPLRPVVADLAAVPAAVVLGTVAGQIAGDLETWHSATLALAAGVLAVAGRRAAAYLAYDAHEAKEPADSAAPAPGGRAAARAARRAAARDARRSGEAVLVLGSALPILLAAPTSYVLGRLLVG